MRFVRIEPGEAARKAVECYWIVEDNDVAAQQQKIIPDGFPEIIFHFGDAYRICLNAPWRLQRKQLMAGQIKGHFFLENTGRSEILGIKMKPAAITHLFGISMKDLTDVVVDLSAVPATSLIDLEKSLAAGGSDHARAILLNNYFGDLCKAYPDGHPADRAAELIVERNGMITVKEICAYLGVGERYLEQLFRKYIGLSPKFYTRIVRFSYIFQIIKDNRPDWSSVVHEAGYYDQSHFIRNFKAFTGEDPTAYMFAEKNLANFFLKKK